MPLPRPRSVSTVTTDGSTRRTSAGISAPAVVTGAGELVGAVEVPVEPELVELLHAARKVTVTASSRSIQTQDRTVDDGCISQRLRLHSITSVPVVSLRAKPARHRRDRYMRTFAPRRGDRHGPVSSKPDTRSWPDRPKKADPRSAKVMKMAR